MIFPIISPTGPLLRPVTARFGLPDALPRSFAGLGLAGALTALWLFQLLGKVGSRVGTYRFEGIDPLWLVLANMVAFFLVRPARVAERPLRVLFLGSTALVLLWGVSIWRERLSNPTGPLSGFQSVLSDARSPTRDSLHLSSARIESRAQLNRFTGLRRNVSLDIEGFVRAPEAGTYRLRMNCDDRCTLYFDGKEVLEAAGGASKDLALTEGLHALRLLYVQEAGPAFLFLDWDRPAFFELLPVEHYMADRGERIASLALRRKEIELALSVLIFVLCYGLAVSVWVRAGERRRAMGQAVLRSVRRIREALPHLKAELARWVIEIRRSGSFLWARKVAAVAGIAAGLVLPLVMQPSEIRVSSSRGDWQAVTAGFKLTGDPGLLGGGPRTVVHFHELDRRAGQLVLDVSARDPGNPVQLVVRSGEKARLRTRLSSKVQTLLFPFEAGRREVEIEIEAEPDRPVRQAVFLLHEIRLSREPDWMSRALRLLPIAAAVVALFLLGRARMDLNVAAGFCLTAGLTCAFVMCLHDPSATLATIPQADMLFRSVPSRSCGLSSFARRRAGASCSQPSLPPWRYFICRRFTTASSPTTSFLADP